MTDPLRLHFDVSLMSSALAALPLAPTPVGTRPTLSIGDLLVALAPVYLEAGALARALTSSMRLPVVPRFGTPLPWPIVQPSTDLVGLSLANSSSDTHLTVCVSLTSGLLCPVVPNEPVLFISLTTTGQMIDPLPFDSTPPTGRQSDSAPDKIASPADPPREADPDEPASLP